MPLSTGKIDSPLSLLFCFLLKIIFGVRGQGDVAQPNLSMYENTIRKPVILWMLGTKPRSSGRATNAFNHGTVSPATVVSFQID